MILNSAARLAKTRKNGGTGNPFSIIFRPQRKNGKRKETPHKQRKDLHFSANLRAVIFIVFYFAEKCKIFH